MLQLCSEGAAIKGYPASRGLLQARMSRGASKVCSRLLSSSCALLLLHHVAAPWNLLQSDAVLHLLVRCRHFLGPLGCVCACGAAWWLSKHSSPAALLQVLPVGLI